MHPGSNYFVEIPAGWAVFNAPRPLCASYQKDAHGDLYAAAWTSAEFLHGLFYSAVAPHDTRAYSDNVDLDGWILEWHDEKEIEKWGREYAKKLRLDYDELDFDDVKRSFFLQLNHE